MKSNSVNRAMALLSNNARNAMHSLLGLLELVAERPLDQAQREHISACRGIADRMLRDVDTLETALQTSPAEPPQKCDFAIHQLMNAIVDVLGVPVRRKRLGLFCEVDPSVPAVLRADRERIEQVLIRIIDALITAADSGDIRMQACWSDQTREIIFEVVAAQATLSPDSIEALDCVAPEGLADPGLEVLGLMAARKNVALLGGTLQVQADRANGSHVTVRVPAGERPERIAITANVQPAHTERPLRVLVAEDSDDSYLLFRAYIEGLPHAVSRARDGMEALQLATSGDFDLIFMDIRMPGMDGYEATRRIRDWETEQCRARVPIVVLSAEPSRAQRRSGGVVGCSGYLPKPLRKQELLAAIQTYSAPLSI